MLFVYRLAGDPPAPRTTFAVRATRSPWFSQGHRFTFPPLKSKLQSSKRTSRLLDTSFSGADGRRSDLSQLPAKDVTENNGRLRIFASTVILLDMKSGSRRRGGWNYDPPPISESTRSKISPREPRRSASARNLALVMLAILVTALMVVAYIVRFHAIDLSRITLPAALKLGNRTISLRGTTPVPAIHNSLETECETHRQCTDAEFAGMVESLQRQWALTPEEIRSKCVAYSTYPPLEHCILSESVTWLAKNPNGEAPWINPKNFDAAIMALCQKDPHSLPLCLKP